MKKSKQAMARESQGFTKEGPRCGNCKHFDYWEQKHGYGSTKRDQKCLIGGFACKPMNYCSEHQFIIKE